MGVLGPEESASWPPQGSCESGPWRSQGEGVPSGGAP